MRPGNPQLSPKWIEGPKGRRLATQIVTVLRTWVRTRDPITGFPALTGPGYCLTALRAYPIAEMMPSRVRLLEWVVEYR